MSIQRGEIYFVDLNPVVGREQAGRRPALVLSVDLINSAPLVVTVVIGTKGQNVPKDFKTNVRVPPDASGLPTETVFMGFQLRALDPQRFSAQPAGRLNDPYLARVENAVRYTLGL